MDARFNQIRSRCRKPTWLLVLAMGMAIGVPGPATAAKYCMGRKATIVGTAGRDRIPGTDGADVIVALGGNDDIDSRGGNDVVCGGPGNDSIYGSPGAEKQDGGSGDDELVGGSGPNRQIGGLGDDLVYTGGSLGGRFSGGGGRDTISFVGRVCSKGVLARLDEGIARWAACDGGYDGKLEFSGVENLTGSQGHDRLVGNGARNVINGVRRGDEIVGLGGDDTLVGGFESKNTIVGGDGDDRIDGGNVSDVLRGNAGNDRFWPLRGDDVISGGPGVDLALFDPWASLFDPKNMTVDLQAGTARGEGVDELDGVEDISTGAGNDSIIGNGQLNRLLGDGASTFGGGSDMIRGGDADDTLLGGPGNDDLFGEEGDDEIDGGGGTDECDQGPGMGSVTNCEA